LAGLSDLTDPKAVHSAIREFDKIGRKAFLHNYGFRPARSYYLLQGGKQYDSKAIAGAAYGYQHPDRGPLAGKDFIGGDATVRPKLISLGFQVVSDATAQPTSGRLKVGQIYPREELKGMFGITDTTVNTGVFRPKGSHSIWLFVTRDKTKDRTQYQDRLDGDLLQWEGQTSGRTDNKIIDHAENGDELLVFYRDSKRQHAKAGFRYEGLFRYLSHIAGKPSRFILQRDVPFAEYDDIGDVESFDPANVDDGRRRVLRSVAQRQGQGVFRRSLMIAYVGSCAVTGCTIEPLLEAAHIRSYWGPETNHVTNGMLLRADIHTLFDLGLLTIGDDHRIEVSARLANTDYGQLQGQKLKLPVQVSQQPSLKSLRWHRERWAYRK
jgi:putative restriction endonuclease